MALQSFDILGLSKQVLEELQLSNENLPHSEIFPFPDNIPFPNDEFKMSLQKKTSRFLKKSGRFSHLILRSKVKLKISG